MKRNRKPMPPPTKAFEDTRRLQDEELANDYIEEYEFPERADDWDWSHPSDGTPLTEIN